MRTGRALSFGFVFPELYIITTVRAFYFKDVVGIPEALVLSWAFNHTSYLKKTLNLILLIF